MPGIAWPLFPAEVTDRYEREDEPVNDHHCYGFVRRRGIEGRVEQCLRRCTRRGIVNDHCQWAAHKCIINRTTWNSRLLRVGSQYSNSTLVVIPAARLVPRIRGSPKVLIEALSDKTVSEVWTYEYGRLLCEAYRQIKLASFKALSERALAERGM